MNQQIFPGSTSHSLPRIDLRQILHQVCRELMHSGGFQMVDIFQWDQANDEAVWLADAAHAAYIHNEGERFPLADYPTTARVLATGEIAAIDSNMVEAETEWMRKYGFNSLLIAPLFEKDSIIGLIEVASCDRILLSRRETIEACESVVREASAWLTAPLKSNSTTRLFDLASELRSITKTTSCSLSAWHPETNEATVVLDYSNAFWSPGSGPRVSLGDWTIARRVLEKNEPKIMVASDPDILPEERKDLEEFKSLTKVIVPLTIDARPIGFIAVSDVEEERSIGIKELFSWGGIAGQAALALQNAQLMDMAQGVLDDQTALRRSIEVMSSSVDRDVILAGLAEQIARAVDATSVYINVFFDDYQSYKAEAGFLSSRGADRETRSILGESRSLTSESQCRRNLQRNQVSLLQVNDPDITADDLEHMERHGSKSRLLVPIYIRDKLYGFAELWESRLVRQFSGKEVDLCISMCLQGAVAIENAELFSRAQDEIKLRRQFEARMRHEALHDPLTRLPNRRLFIDRLEQAILRRSRQENFEFAVLYFDLDKFKWINDSFGHKCGDSVLVQVAECIRNCIRKCDTAARFGGDEFLILAEGEADSRFIDRVCNDIQAKLRSLVSIEDRRIPLAASIGVSMSTEELMSADDYINRADIAMYEAKSSGGSHVKRFATDEITLPLRNLDLRAEVRDAVANEGFTMNYQPIIDLEKLEVESVEALIRWQRSNGEIVSPTKFIPIAEDLRLISELGFWIARESIHQFKQWQRKYTGFEQMTLSLNLSINQVTDPEFTRQLKKIVDSLDFPPSRINLEITENLFIHNVSLVSSVLRELQGMGFSVHLDDFGTGFSSLSYLTELPFDVIKIDRSFVSKLGSQNEPRELLDSIVSIGKNLKKEVIAEGIETEEQLAILKSMNCRYGQGFLFSSALPAPELESLLQEWQFGQVSRK